MDKTIGDNRVVRPDWSLCMGYELELRREAIKNTRESGMAIHGALWSAYHNEHHRLENLSNFVRLSGTPHVAEKDKQIQQLQNKASDLECKMRSRSPRGRNSQLALTDSSSHSSAPAKRGKSKGKGRGTGSSGKTAGKSSDPKQIQTFHLLIKMDKRTRPKSTTTTLATNSNTTNAVKTIAHVLTCALGAERLFITTIAGVCQPERSLLTRLRHRMCMEGKLHPLVLRLRRFLL